MPAKRRGNGEGSIRRRKDGRWTALLRYIDPLTDLARREQLYGRSRGEVVDKLAELRRRIKAGEPTRDARVCLSAFLDRWFVDVAKPTIKPSTARSYESVITHHLKPALGARALADLRPATIAHLLVGEGARGPAPSRKKALIILSMALDVAVRWRFIASNPAASIDPPRSTKVEIRPMSPAQVLVFLDVARADRLLALYLMAIFAGPRLGEMLALRWPQ
ncbi:MAG: site-specific integrase, partial [Rhodanobacteraceae bacterium]